MSEPFQNMNVVFETRGYSIDLTNTEKEIIQEFKSTKNITNYEYEVQNNEDKRQILILKKEYLGAFISDMKNIMKYGKSSQYIDDKTKKV